MPTNTLSPDEDPCGPGMKVSHSSRWNYGLCSRSWFYEKEYGWRGLALPLLVFGHAVEETVCRVLRESPELISANAASHVLDSPTHQKTVVWGRRDRQETHIDQRPESEEKWLGPKLMLFGDAPSDIEEIRKWAHARVDVHWPRAIEGARIAWENDANRSGNWNEFMQARGNLGPNHAKNALDMHIEEVLACLEANGGPTLESWRKGIRPIISAPDGRPNYHTIPHPFANSEGSATLAECWEIARPWFVDPEAGSFTQQAMLPEGWFQGEYDLVYRWEGTPRIVDLKASNGTSEWAAAYPVQMKTYAWLWWASHDHEMVSGLETWYMGAASRKKYNLPSQTDLQKMQQELNQFWHDHMATRGSRDITNYPPNPAPVPSHSPGGGDVIEVKDPSERCKVCLWANICEGSGEMMEISSTEWEDVNGTSHQFNDLSQVNSRVNVFGTISTWKGGEWRHGGIAPALGIWGGGTSTWVSSYKGGPKEIPEGLHVGSKVRVIDTYFAKTRKGGLQLKLDDLSRIEIAEEAKEGDIVPSSLPRINIRGRVMSLAKGQGEHNFGTWKRWGASIATENGNIDLSAMNEDIPFISAEINRGDEIVILNAIATAFGAKLQGALDQLSQIAIIK
ncbi:MAG TPA: hypothetical protein EYQ53_04315 [Candidatus Poseidoniales archaeon]|jgi:hypothetical protein|nr:MAG: hypothetical protein CXT69_04615 [Euryarchaeota archaeon]HIG03587.1 hypothetical protein [Candidatus Poseidoniales archaeon]HIK77998.1 hypothetical protein [Candidatus Poseidoniales archaeon]